MVFFNRLLPVSVCRLLQLAESKTVLPTLSPLLSVSIKNRHHLRSRGPRPPSRLKSSRDAPSTSSHMQREHSITWCKSGCGGISDAIPRQKFNQLKKKNVRVRESKPILQIKPSFTISKIRQPFPLHLPVLAPPHVSRNSLVAHPRAFLQLLPSVVIIRVLNPS